MGMLRTGSLSLPTTPATPPYSLAVQLTRRVEGLWNKVFFHNHSALINSVMRFISKLGSVRRVLILLLAPCLLVLGNSLHTPITVQIVVRSLPFHSLTNGKAEVLIASVASACALHKKQILYIWPGSLIKRFFYIYNSNLSIN